MRIKNISVFTSFGNFLVLLIIVSFHVQTKAADGDDQNAGRWSRSDRVYIVYMGSAAVSSTSSDDLSSLKDDHAQLLSSVRTRKPNAVVYTYKHGFSGFAARLSNEEARSIAEKPGVVSVFPDPLLKLHTTHSWDFLKYQTALKIDSNLNSKTMDRVSSVTTDGSDTIIGLVYETETVDYLNYLCYYGYDLSKIKTISRTVPKEFTCPKDSNADYISNINYPSIAISNFNGKESKNVTRKVTNVAGDGETVFSATVDAPSGLTVKVIPEKLQFSKNNQKLSYQVVFSPTTSSPKEDMFGSVTWTNGKYRVRSPFVIDI
ncbi:unnamed protein product [Malus baccata var. baccata]